MIIQYQEIKKYIAHRYPMLLIDRIIDIQPMEYCVGIKNISGNDPVFQGHYPDMPIYPGVLMVEALGQLSGFLYFYSHNITTDTEYSNMIILAGMDKIRFRSPIYPGDQLYLYTRAERKRDNFWRFYCEGYKYADTNEKEKILVVSGKITAVQKKNI